MSAYFQDLHISCDSDAQAIDLDLSENWETYLTIKLYSVQIASGYEGISG